MRGTCVPRKVTKCTKLGGAQRSAELALRSMDFRAAPENLISPALLLYKPLAENFFSILLTYFQTWIGIDWYSCGTSRTIFTCLPLSMW